MKKRTAEKNRVWIEALLGIAVFVLLAYISTFVFVRFDLTEEKRHTLSPTTINLVESLDDVVYVKVYLEGDFPADYQRLSRAIKEKLDEMRAYAGDNIQYEFINPSASPDKNSREAMYRELIKKGLEYSSLQIRDKGGVTEKIVFPGALISYRNKEVPLQILQNKERATDAEMVNRTINNLEYAFVNAIYQLQREDVPKVAFLEGHGELSEMQTKDFELELKKYYKVERVVLDGNVNALSKNIAGKGSRVNRYDAVILAKPQKPFNEKDKYILDQFIMNGGKVMWLIDQMQVRMDSLKTSDMTMAVPLKLNLSDMLFNYGVRINNDLLIDRVCAPISLLTGPEGNQRYRLFPWYFSPILIPEQSHPTTANVDPILTNFISSIDTVATPHIRKKIILTTSEYTRILKAPVRVSLNIVSIDPDFKNSDHPNEPVAVMLEGKFTSNYLNRLPPKFLNQKLLDFQEESPFNRMLVISDGDVIRNEVSPDGTRFRSLNYDPVLNKNRYGNKAFLINSMNYLLGDASLINVRSRSIKVRKLNTVKVDTQRYFWQLFNIGLPILLTLLFGIGQWIWRKNKYTK